MWFVSSPRLHDTATPVFIGGSVLLQKLQLLEVYGPSSLPGGGVHVDNSSNCSDIYTVDSLLAGHPWDKESVLISEVSSFQG